MLDSLLLSKAIPALSKQNPGVFAHDRELLAHVVGFISELSDALKPFGPNASQPEAWKRFSVLDVGCGSPETSQFLARITGGEPNRVNEPWFCRVAAAVGMGRVVGLDVHPNAVETGWSFEQGDMLQSETWENLGVFNLVHMNRVVPGPTDFPPSPKLQEMLGLVDEKGADPQAVFRARDTILGHIDSVLARGGLLSWDGELISKDELPVLRQFLRVAIR